MSVLDFKYRGCSGLVCYHAGWTKLQKEWQNMDFLSFSPCAASSFNTVQLCHLLRGKHCAVTLLQAQMRCGWEVSFLTLLIVCWGEYRKAVVISSVFFCLWQYGITLIYL